MESENFTGDSDKFAIEERSLYPSSVPEISALLDDWKTFCEQILPMQPWSYKAGKEFAHLDRKQATIKESQNICKICGQIFKNTRGVKQHMGKLHENKDRLWSCKCGKTFKNKYALKTHIKQVHEGSDKVECPICKKLVYNKYVLSKHMLHMHY